MYGRAEAGGFRRSDRAHLGARDRAFLATKVWTQGRGGRHRPDAQFHAPDARRFDHRPDPGAQSGRLADPSRTLRAWKEAGTVRYIGITHYTESALPTSRDHPDGARIDFVQLPYSIAWARRGRPLLPLAADTGIAVIVNRPFERSPFSVRRRDPLPAWAAELGIEAGASSFSIHPGPAGGDLRHPGDRDRATWPTTSTPAAALPDQRMRLQMLRAAGAG